MLMPVLETDRQFQKKEEYAQRFMIVFLPFRTKADLMEEGSYQRKFQTAYREHLFSAKMIAIANNIQAIQNSIESGIPENSLSSRTILPEEDEFDVNGNDADTAMGYEDLLSSIGDMFDEPGGVRLESDATCLNPNFSGKRLQGKRSIAEESDGEERELFSVIERDTADDAIATTEEGEEHLLPVRFKTAASELNSLLMQQQIVRQQEEAPGGVAPNEIKAPDACGSWQSIVNWAQIAGLDPEQQVAFEVLAATYVLTFYDEASENSTDEIEFRENKARLLQLARRKPTTESPLRMFVTGPAGAGKCKEQTIV
jgi:hypothetical protein